MNPRSHLQKSLLALSLLPTLALGAERVGDFSLLDQDGYFHQMSWYDDNQAIVLLVQAAGDAAVQDVLADFDTLKSSFEATGHRVLHDQPTGLERSRCGEGRNSQHGISMCRC